MAEPIRYQDTLTELSEAVSWIRVVGEELGSKGDRTVILADIRKLKAERDALRNDSERLDFLEQAIRDGSFSVLVNDLFAQCQHAYKVFGPGPALRSSIDGSMGQVAAGRSVTDAYLRSKCS